MIIEYYFKNWGFEFVYDNIRNCGKHFLLIIGNKMWESKKTYPLWNEKSYKNSRLCKGTGWIKYLPFGIRYIMIDINHNNIPFMFSLTLEE